MLRRLALRDFVLVHRLELELAPGFTVLTGETGAGKSILVDALQFVLGARADVASVREGAPRAEVSAEFDPPASLSTWLEAAGFDAGEALLLRRTVDEQGRSRAWVNGSAATVAQLREAAGYLVEIHGQHAWQSLMRPAGARVLLDEQAGVDTAELDEAWRERRAALDALEQARTQADARARECERLQWQVGELDKLDPHPQEWEALQAEHTRLAHAQSLLEAAREALEALTEGEPAVDTLLDRAAAALAEAGRHDPALGAVAQVLREAQAPVQDAARTLHAYVAGTEPDPARLTELDTRLSAWLGLARRHRCPPPELPHLLARWREELRTLEAAADLPTLQQAADAAHARWLEVARTASRQRQRHAPQLAAAVTQAMQQLGMAGGRLEVALPASSEPEPHGLEAVEFLVAGHAGSSPRPLARVASGGELSRLALAIAATTAREQADRLTLVFDEIDAGVGGTVADSVGRLMKQLGTSSQVLAVTHLAQVAACADAHVVVSKSVQAGSAATEVQPVTGEARVAELARMLGGERLSGLAHAQAMLGSARA
ncbi:MAG: repair protein RecN [Pseudomonadota bacterium]|jgi:DNA repair protein RecN (Recombination protein N)